MVPICGGQLRDLPDAVQRDVVAAAGQRLAERGELDRDLGAGAEAVGAEGLQQPQVGVAAGVRGGPVGDVLAEVVEGDLQAARGQRADGVHRRVQLVAGDEAVHHGSGDGRGGDDAAHTVAARGGEQHGTEHGVLLDRG